MTLKTIILIFPLLALLSCVNKEKTISSLSPDGLSAIDIHAKKSSIASPWSLSFTISRNNKKSSFETEMYADEPLLNKNILFNWESNTSCVILLIEQDGSQRSIPVKME
jgi:hypothetical protein